MTERRKDAGDEKSVKHSRDVLALMQADEADLFRKMLDQYGFREFLHSLMFEKCRIQDTTFHDNPHEHAMREGRRSIGQEIFTKVLTLRPEAITIMQREALGRQSKGESR